DVATERFDLLDQLRAPYDVYRFDAERFGDRDNRASDAGIGAVLDHPVAALERHDIGQQQIGCRRINPEHRKLLNIGLRQGPQPGRIGLYALRPGRLQQWHESAIAFLEMPDIAADGRDTSDALDTQNAWQWRQITVSPGNDQEIRAVDGRGLGRDHHLV